MDCFDCGKSSGELAAACMDTARGNGVGHAPRHARKDIVANALLARSFVARLLSAPRVRIHTVDGRRARTGVRGIMEWVESQPESIDSAGPKGAPLCCLKHPNSSGQRQQPLSHTSTGACYLRDLTSDDNRPTQTHTDWIPVPQPHQQKHRAINSIAGASACMEADRPSPQPSSAGPTSQYVPVAAAHDHMAGDEVGDMYPLVRERCHAIDGPSSLLY